MVNDTIFVVTTLSCGVTRAWGWYPTFNEAVVGMHSSADLLFEEGSSKTVTVIEEISSGISTNVTKETWYQTTYDDHEKIYVISETQKPASLVGDFEVVNFGLG